MSLRWSTWSGTVSDWLPVGAVARRSVGDSGCGSPLVVGSGAGGCHGGEGLVGGEFVHETELVAEGVLHDGPVEEGSIIAS